MAAQVPARQPSLMRKQSIHACLRLRWIENELRLSVFLQHRLVMIPRNRAVRISMNRLAQPKNSIVQTIRHSRHTDHSKNYGEEDSSQPHSEVWGGCQSHDAR